jgi:hypothetical protein
VGAKNARLMVVEHQMRKFVDMLTPCQEDYL